MATPTQNTIGEIRAEANIILKVVDQCIKAGLLNEAKGHLEKARLIDPTNAYIYAFEERISFLTEETSKRNAAVSNRVVMEDAARAKLDVERRRAEEERLKREAEQARRLEEGRQKKIEAGIRRDDATSQSAPKGIPQPTPAPKSTNHSPVISSEPKRMVDSAPPRRNETPQQQRTDNEPVKRSDVTQPQRPVASAESQSYSAMKTSGQAYDMYKRVLLLAWADGAISPEEQAQLQDLQSTLCITAEVHTKLELQAKEESYAHALALVISTGMNSKERSAVINELRQKYQISLEAHSKIESKLLSELGAPQNRQMIYVIDDEESILGILVRILEGGGYDVKTFNTSDEALVGLQNDMPDLIISDINLETSSIGGFSFYEKVRQFHHLSHVPFIFLSGMTDEGMIRYGKSLGVDDYLTKPFTGEMLLDTIKGKLKRYKQMKHN